MESSGCLLRAFLEPEVLRLNGRHRNQFETLNFPGNYYFSMSVCTLSQSREVTGSGVQGSGEAGGWTLLKEV